MSDVFISYASEDKPRAELLARALAAAGWSVWWDRKIPPGKSYDDVIEEALDAARCVVVLWSKHSVRSDWVKAEASEGMKRRVLVPAVLEEVRVPLEFRRLQAASLMSWQGASSHPELEELLAAVAETLGQARAPDARRDVIVERLRAVGLFSPLSEAELALLAKSTVSHSFTPGESITETGEAGASMFVVMSGRLNVRIEHEGAMRTIAELREGDFFGEMALLTGTPRTGQVVAAEESEVLEIGRTAFRRLLHGNPALAESIGKTLGDRRAGLAANMQAKSGDEAAGLMAAIKSFFRIP